LKALRLGCKPEGWRDEITIFVVLRPEAPPGETNFCPESFLSHHIKPADRNTNTGNDVSKVLACVRKVKGFRSEKTWSHSGLVVIKLSNPLSSPLTDTGLLQMHTNNAATALAGTGKYSTGIVPCMRKLRVVFVQPTATVVCS